jgi:putative oxidoreductase
MIKRLMVNENLFSNGLILTRVATGIIITTYGVEIFVANQVNGYTQWLTDIHFPFPRVMAYLGKLVELVGGICLTLGLFTRFVMIPLVMTMAVITFIMGDGNFRSDSFLLLLLFMTFLFTGSGKWSMDQVIFSKNKRHYDQV